MTSGCGTVLGGMAVGSVTRVGAGKWTVMRSTEFFYSFTSKMDRFGSTLS
jgi:hypothetical protein